MARAECTGKRWPSWRAGSRAPGTRRKESHREQWSERARRSTPAQAASTPKKSNRATDGPLAALPRRARGRQAASKLRLFAVLEARLCAGVAALYPGWKPSPLASARIFAETGDASAACHQQPDFGGRRSAYQRVGARM